MLWKGLAVSGAVAVAAFAIVAALAFGTAPKGGTLAQPATGNVVVLPNGVAAPQLQPAQPASAPLLVSEGSLVSLVEKARDSAEATAVKLAAERQTGATNAAEQKALTGCAGK
ncbi:MAG: hypothetical protein RMK84_17725 [Oscillochloridaceae bacterium]|nr:hypothetical protein [Chloroflexaceae bacterium]MDW8391964.1 hypothetical protein [Oscillochloridaceae bacterium]